MDEENENDDDDDDEEEEMAVVVKIQQKEEEEGRRSRRRRKIEEDYEDGCIRGEAGNARGNQELRRGARTAEVKRNVNGRKSGGHRWMKKQKDIDDGR